MLELEFEWDIRKERENIRLHGVYFDDAAEAFYDRRRMERRDDDSDYYEDRWQTLCSLPTGDVIFAVYTERGDAIRIIELFGNFSFRTTSAENSKIRSILQDLFDN